MKRIVLTLDLYTKIILTIIAVTTMGLFLHFSLDIREASAKNDIMQVDITRVGGRPVGYDGAIPVKQQ